MRSVKSFCRSCGAMCGTVVSVGDDGRIAQIRADRENPMSNGYACVKGLHADEMHNSPDRLLHTMKRMPDGGYSRIDTELALDEIAEKLASLIDRYGPDTVATYTGAHSWLTATAWMMVPMFRSAMGTSSNYSTTTIDQSAKFVAVERLGAWAAGKPPISESDVVMLIGANPLVAHSTAGCLVADPVKTLKREKARGLKLIVIDPRRSESAAFADIFIQPYPGEDPAVVSGLLRLLLTEGWADEAFIAQYVREGGVDRVRELVAPFDPDYVARRAGIDADDLRRAARMFGEASKGSAFSGTGPSMAPRANLSEHLIELLNVVCGRYRRAGDVVRNIDIFSPPKPFHAEVVAPARYFEKVPPSRIRGAGSLWGEKMTSTLPDEILTPGEGQVTALINAGGNPASSFPDQRKVVDAMKALDLFITIGPYLNNSARLSHYVFAPKLQYERVDLPMLLDFPFYSVPWGQYTPAVVAPPPGSDLIDDWYLFWGIAKRLGLQLDYKGVPIDMETPPTSDDLIEIRTRGSIVPLDEIKRHDGHIFDVEDKVRPGRPEAADNRFDPMPDDVAAVLEEVAAEPLPSRIGEFTHLLQVRRVRETNNSSSVSLNAVRKRMPYNWAAMHPDDIATMSLADGAKITVTSDHGSVPAVVKQDETVKPGVLAMTHGWGGLPGEAASYEQEGANVNLLISNERDVEPINAMVRMSAIPVNISMRE